MFNKRKIQVLMLTVLTTFAYSNVLFAEEASIANITASDLPINVSNSKATDTVSSPIVNKDANALVSPSEPRALTADKVDIQQQLPVANANPLENPSTKNENTNDETESNAKTLEIKSSTKNADVDVDFDFDLKMKSIANPTSAQSVQADTDVNKSVEKDQKKNEIEADLPKEIQYSVDPIENLGNSVLSTIDSDLFKQMSEIEKSTTLLTLELKREKIRNEIEAQKAIRQRTYDEAERQKNEQKFKDFEKKKNIESKILREKQAILDKEKLIEILRQRKLLNAYMNEMLMQQQAWLKEKEALYARIEKVENEKKELINLFKQKIDSVLEVSAKNIKVAQTAKANFERIVKGLKARNEQLRRRVEADSKIIKNARNSLYLKSQSIEELKERNASQMANSAAIAAAQMAKEEAAEIVVQDELIEPQESLSAKYAILGITGKADTMSMEVIDINGIPVFLKVGSSLPTGHVVSEIGADYAVFSRDGENDYLYVGRSIDGVIPTLNVSQ